ncbi:unnamed protein product [Closterium sp. Yama58-4]|nr:unnamed protein product [Closterium sp. Yama58-4]
MSLFGLTSLRDLTLSLGLGEFPDQFGRLKFLKRLTLECLHITDLPDSIGQLTALTELSISNCKRLQDLPDSIGNLRSLQKLELFRAKPLEVLPDSIGQLQNLENLFLYHNRSLCELPDSFFHLLSLKVLKLWKLKDLPELDSAVSNLVNLEMLQIDKCWFESLPDSICQVPNLRRLMVTDCWDLTSLPRSIGDVSSLQRLKFRDLGVTQLPGSISKLSDLRSFVLKGCGTITEVPTSLFQDCTNLVKLEFDWPYSCRNGGQAGGAPSAEAFVSNICRLSSLTSLVLSGVPDLNTLPPQIGNLLGLERLKLRFWNKLTSLPDSMSKLVRLYTLDIVACPAFDKTINEIPGSEVLSSACAVSVSPANGATRSRTSAVAPIRASAQAENQPSAHPSTSATPPSAASPEALPRRSVLAGGLLALASATLSAYLPLPALPPVAHAAADAAATAEAAGGSELLKGLRSAFDSEEVTASGRRLPKAYVRSVTALVSSLRDALGAEEGERGEFRRKAEVAKGAIRAYLGEWRGKAPENTEIITSSLDSVLRTLSRFYMRTGVNAKLPADVRDGILADLALAEAAL